MGACGICGQVYETDLRIREPFEPRDYQLRFWARDDLDGRVATTVAKITVTR